MRAPEIFSVHSFEDIVLIRQRVRAITEKEGFKLVDQTKMVTAVSELARNAIIYGGGGTASVEWIQQGSRFGIRVEFKDQGSGITDIELAMKDGYTSGSGLGLGLGGAKRLTDEFELESTPGGGTRVSITRWR